MVVIFSFSSLSSPVYIFVFQFLVIEVQCFLCRCFFNLLSFSGRSLHIPWEKRKGKNLNRWDVGNIEFSLLSFSIIYIFGEITSIRHNRLFLVRETTLSQLSMSAQPTLQECWKEIEILQVFAKIKLFYVEKRNVNIKWAARVLCAWMLMLQTKEA